MKKTILVSCILLLTGIGIHAQEIFNAVKNHDVTKAKLLIETNSKLVNAKDGTGRTPLHWAARGVDLELMTYLIRQGADVNALDNNHMAPIMSVTRTA